MKKLFFLLFLLPVLLQAQTTYYIATTGSNVTGDGSSGNPWETLAYAVSVVSSGDKVLMKNGTYNISSQINVPEGITIEGETEAGAIINSSYGGAGQPLLKLETANGWLSPTVTQRIGYLTMVGNNTTYSAIQVNYRSNVIINHCTIYDFTTTGIIFSGMAKGSWTTPSIFEPDYTMPDHFTTGNVIYSCTITNNSGSTNVGANIRFGSQNGFQIYDCTITQPIRGVGTNCGGIKFFDDGYNKNTKIHDNDIDVTINTNNLYNFALEIWFELGGCEYYDNTIRGTFDLDCTNKGTSTYATWIHDNDIGQAAYRQHHSNASSTLVGIDIEGYCKDVIVERNYIHHVRDGIYFSHIWPNGDHSPNNIFENIRISTNILAYIGLAAGGAADWEPVYGIYCGREQETAGTSEMNNIDILNNTIICGSLTAESYYALGIWLPQCDMIVNGMNVQNNIIKGFTGGTGYSAAVFGTGAWGSNDINDLVISYNDFYGNTSNIQFIGGYSPSPYTNTPNITDDPLLAADYKIDASSPAYMAGVDVGLSTDYAGFGWNTPPSIGAYEFNGIPPAVSIVGLVIYGNRFVIYNNRLIKIE